MSLIKSGARLSLPMFTAAAVVFGAMLLLMLALASTVSATQSQHVPIYINGNENFTPANGVNGGGTGTADNPYIIENWAIDASGANGIDIQNTTAYFVVRNCLVENGGWFYCGIYLDNVINGKIENNTCSSNRNGIYLASSSNNDLTGNTCENNRCYDILLFSSYYNVLENNTCGPNAEPFFTTVGAYQITTSSATIVCNTDENATCIIEYGTTTEYGLAQSDNTLVESHSIVLTGLSPGTTYHYIVESKDAAGNESVWGDSTFTVSGFSMSTSQTSGSIVQGGSITAIISLSPVNGFGSETGIAKSDSGSPEMTSVSQIFYFSSTVSLSASGLPSGATASFDPPSGTPSFPSTFTISTDPTTPAGTYRITITGTGGGVTHTCAYELTVLPTQTTTTTTTTTTSTTSTTTSPTTTTTTTSPTGTTTTTTTTAPPSEVWIWAAVGIVIVVVIAIVAWILVQRK
jgi:parallel beta-helix repeat protein